MATNWEICCRILSLKPVPERRTIYVDVNQYTNLEISNFQIKIKKLYVPVRNKGKYAQDMERILIPTNKIFVQ